MNQRLGPFLNSLLKDPSSNEPPPMQGFIMTYSGRGHSARRNRAAWLAVPDLPVARAACGVRADHLDLGFWGTWGPGGVVGGLGNDGPDYSALKSWVPGGRIDQYEWSIKYQNQALPVRRGSQQVCAAALRTRGLRGQQWRRGLAASVHSAVPYGARHPAFAAGTHCPAGGQRHRVRLHACSHLASGTLARSSQLSRLWRSRTHPRMDTWWSAAMLRRRWHPPALLLPMSSCILPMRSPPRSWSTSHRR